MQPADHLNQVVAQAVAKAASDIYLFPKVVGYELIIHTASGIVKLTDLSTERAQQLIAYIKYEANMVISDHRRPQLGALTYRVGQRELHLRLSTVGDFQDHESMVIRIIYPLASFQKHVTTTDQWRFLTNLATRRGLMVFSGPTGSGKTTSLYRLARQFSEESVILSIEDPVEIHESSFLQLQINELAGMDYNALLKLALRHRPDVLLIGEIRDEQTAKVALQAALSGHLVLSTVHAQNVLGVVSRLEQLGVSNQDLEQALTAVCYQRLVPGIQQPLVIYDWLSNDELFGEQRSKIRWHQQMTGRWHDALNQSVFNGQVAPNVAEAFRAG
ncbi:competence type IV pilus ATPase ComGA [Furfurilactobacillus curtus]|uniref:Competence protein n=1 Tax=Furfurilactobacillus curtus TaxID=1746200 RepID=A0ABQ5JNH2_9LACO